MAESFVPLSVYHKRPKEHVVTMAVDVSSLAIGEGR